MSKSSKNNPGNLTKKGKEQLKNKTMKLSIKRNMTAKEKKLLNARLRKEKARIENLNSIFDPTLKANIDDMDSNELNNISPEDLYEDIYECIDKRDIDDRSKRSKKELDILDKQLKLLTERRKTSGKTGKYNQKNIDKQKNYDFYVCVEIDSDDMLSCKNPFQYIKLEHNQELLIQNEILPTISSSDDSALISIKNVYDTIHPMKYDDEDEHVYTINQWSKKMEEIGCQPFHKYNPNDINLICCHLVCKDVLVYSLFEFCGKDNRNNALYKWINYCFYNSEPPK
jgi:hypothetical protein